MKTYSLRSFTALQIFLSALVIVGAAALTLTLGDAVSAATTSSVTATVTVQNVSVTVTDGTVAYGTLATNTSASTIAADLNDLQTATNNGNVAETLNILGNNTTAWTLSGTAGSEQYVHSFCKTSCSSPPTNFTALTTSYQTLNSNVAASGTQTFDLRITTPTSTSSFTQQSPSVTVQAVGN